MFLDFIRNTGLDAYSVFRLQTIRKVFIYTMSVPESTKWLTYKNSTSGGNEHENLIIAPAV